jgi:hypothetical protein
MPSNAIVFKAGKPLIVLDTETVNAKIITTENVGGTTSAVLQIEFPIDPSCFKMVTPTVNNVGTVSYPIVNGEVGVLPNTKVQTQSPVKDTFNIKGVGGLPQLNLTMMLDESKIDFGN